MRKAIALVGVVAFVASAATAAVEIFPTTRDSFVLGHRQEMQIGGGQVTRHRMAKADWQHFQLFDFDFAAINAAIAADPTATVRFKVYYDGGGADNQQILVRAFTAPNDWTEGDQTGAWTSFGWTEDTKQVTRNYAGAEWMWDYGDPTTDVDDKKVWDVANCTLWDPADANVWLEDLPYTENGNYVPVADKTVMGYRGCVLDAAFLTALTDADLKGIYVTTGSWANAMGLSRERGTGGQYAAYIIVPEPASLVVLGLGGLALLRRKRR
jgi:hypothetical protein